MVNVPTPLLNAYLSTVYHVETSQIGAFDILIGRHSVDADALCAKLDQRSWLFITAHNPRSRELGDDENAELHRALLSCVREKGLSSFEGFGIGADPTWKPERSLLVPGISRNEAIALGKKFEQYAVVFGDADSPAELILIPLD